MNRTRNRYFILLFSMILCFVLGACRKTEPLESSATESLETESGQKETESVLGEQQSAASSETTGSETKTQKSADELIAGFLKGEERVCKGSTDYGVYDGNKLNPYFIPFVDDNGYTLKEFLGRVQELEAKKNPNTHIARVYYDTANFGVKGEKELILLVQTEGEDWEDNPEFQFYIRPVDGKLVLNYRCTSGYTDSEYLANKSGLIISSWYGVDDHYITYSLLDEEGQKHDLWTQVYYYNMGVYNDSFAGVGATEIAEAAKTILKQSGDDFLFESVGLEGYDFEAKQDPLAYLYTYDGYWKYSGEAPDQNVVEKVEQAFRDANEKIFTEEEIENLKASRVRSFGYDANVLDTENNTPEWEELTREEFWPGELVTVSNTDQLINAISDNAMILLEPGTYDLTQWLMAEDHMKKLRGYSYNTEEYGENPTGVLYDGYSSDDFEIIINNIHNLVLVSKDSSNPAQIVCDGAHARVLAFANCSNINLENLIFGHEVEPGTCSGDVVGMDHTYYSTIKGCDLYGCGAYALSFESCDSIYVTDSEIHDCTYGCVRSYESGWISFGNTVFRDCREYDMFEISGGHFSFDDCTFHNLEGNMVYADMDGSASFYNCKFDNNLLQSLYQSPLYDSAISIY